MSDARTPAPNPDFFQQLLAGGQLPSNVPELRALLENFAGMLNLGLPSVGAFHPGELIREVDGARVTADVIVPEGRGPHPVLVYLHGGGWVCGSPTTHNKLAHRFAEAGYLVMNVDYRLAPEAPFPAGFEDCVAAVHWAASEAGRFGGDPERMAIGGDSAGGNLSAAVAAALADDPSAPDLRAALLIYGVFDFGTMIQMVDADDPMAQVARPMIDTMVGSYLGERPWDARVGDVRVSPLHHAERLPPSYVLVGTADPLVEQAQTLVEVLARADVEHVHDVVDGMPHGFVQMEFFPQARESIGRMLGFLQKHVPV